LCSIEKRIASWINNKLKKSGAAIPNKRNCFNGGVFRVTGLRNLLQQTAEWLNEAIVPPLPNWLLQYKILLAASKCTFGHCGQILTDNKK